MAIAACLLLAACGSDAAVDAAKGTVVNGNTTTVAPATTAVEATSTTPTVEETTTTVEETTTTAAAPVVAGPADGVVFTDPEGAYTMQISPSWIDASDEFPGDIEGWFTGEESADFAENVNVLTDSIPSSTPLAAILEASIGELEGQFPSFALIRSELVAGTSHPELGLLEYSAVQQGLDLRFIQVFGVWNDTLVVFTGSTDGRLGEEGANRLRPYALTLAPAG